MTLQPTTGQHQLYPNSSKKAISINRLYTRHIARNAGDFSPTGTWKASVLTAGHRHGATNVTRDAASTLSPEKSKIRSARFAGRKQSSGTRSIIFLNSLSFKEFLLPYLDTLRGTSNAKNYAIGWIKDELHDWCITRTLEWGVKFPGRDDLVVYVWVDAPIGYIAFTEEWAKKAGKDWKRYWCGENRVTHFIGGDIIYHHSIFWPALLKAAGYGVPHAIVASGMVKVDDHKFSKSRGYVVWTNDDYLDKGLPADYLRYYLLAYTSHTKELNFSWKVFSERINNEVVNIFGNFVYRTLFFAHKEFNGVPSCPARSGHYCRDRKEPGKR